MKKKKAGEIIDNAYFELVRRFPQKPIASDRAIHTVNELVDRGFENLTHGEEAYLDVLSDLVEKYENAHHSIPDASPVAMLKFFIADRNTNQRAVALGSGFGDFFFLRDFDIRDGLLNRRLDGAGKIVPATFRRSPVLGGSPERDTCSTVGAKNNLAKAAGSPTAIWSAMLSN